MTITTVAPAVSRRLSRLPCLLFLLAWLPAAPVVAQDVPRGAIRGEVTAGGMPVAAADVELLKGGTVDRRGTTDANGRFLFVGVPIGLYEVRVSLIGYRTESAKGIRLAGGQTELVRLDLEVAPVTLETMQVITSGVQVDTRSTEFATRISEQQIRLLPLGRDPKDVVALTPGARASHVWGGATAQANNYQIDGLAANHPGIGGDVVQLNMNWIDRIEVRGLGAGAEHGNFQGGLVNVVTKSGDNRTEVAVHTSVESHRLNASNLVSTEIGSEVANRYDVEVEARGPVVRDHFFYYLSAQLVDEDTRFLSHLLNRDARYSPVLQDGRDVRLFGKLTWQPTTRDRVEGSIIRIDTRQQAAGNTGYETREGTLNLERAATLYNLQLQRNWSSGTSIEAKIAHLGLDEERTSLGGPDVPGIQTFALLPPYRAYQNAPMRFVHEPSSTTGTLAFTLRQKVAGYEHALKLGVEHSVGRHVDQRLRNGGMTWRPPVRPTLDAADPATWFTSPSAPFVPITVGGEVNLDAQVENSAAFAQATLGIGPYLSLNPGIRYGRWLGRITPAGGGETFTAVQDDAFEPRLGAILDLSRQRLFVLKGHWGQYHQSMIAQFFDRVEGGNVFTNEENWHYRGPMFTDPATRFTAAERVQLEQQGLLEQQRVLVLNETGRVENYRQPYVNQWLVGVERSFGTDVKMEALYTRRSNRQMVALMDVNRATNYTRFEYIRVLDADGNAIPFEGGRAQFRELYVPNNRIVELLRIVARGECVDGCAAPPGMVPADTLGLTWDPQYVLTNAPDARRNFGQLQFSLQVARPTWGGNISVVMTNLEGNLDSVTGYDDPAGYGPGPYVRVNEAVNGFGKLGNFADRELKLSVYGNLPWRLQGGAFWTYATGDHFAPHFTFASRNYYQYRTYYGNRAVFHPLLRDLEGHRIFIGPRGGPTYQTRAAVDLRLEREFSLPGRGTMMVRAELFNLLNAATPTEFNTSINRGRNYYWFLGPQREGMFATIDPNEYYRAVLERMPPRRLRLGTTVRF